MSPITQRAITDVITACDSVILALCGDNFPDARHISNAMNMTIDDMNLWFMTSRATPKFTQLKNNSKCCLYYFDDKTRHAVRLYGDILIENDINMRQSKWNDDFRKFGYGGPDDSDFILLRFVPYAYKYYIGNNMKYGQII